MVNVAPVNCGAQQYRRARPISLRLSACGTLSPGFPPLLLNLAARSYVGRGGHPAPRESPRSAAEPSIVCDFLFLSEISDAFYENYPPWLDYSIRINDGHVQREADKSSGGLRLRSVSGRFSYLPDALVSRGARRTEHRITPPPRTGLAAVGVRCSSNGGRLQAKAGAEAVADRKGRYLYSRSRSSPRSGSASGTPNRSRVFGNTSGGPSSAGPLAGKPSPPEIQPTRVLCSAS